MNVVIIPPPKLGGVYDDNRIWARQYAAADNKNRSIVEMGHGNLASAAVRASEIAARQAGRDGSVIYAVGHGGVGTQSTSATADLAPKRQLQISQFLAFYDAQTAWPGKSIRQMETDLISINHKKLKRAAAKKKVDAWCRTYIRSNCPIAQRQVLDLPRVQHLYDEVIEIYHRQPVYRIILLTCNVGNATAFVDEVSTDFGVPVLAYRRRVMSQRHGLKVRMFLEGDVAGAGTNTDRALTELMPDAQVSDYYVGRIIVSRTPMEHSAVPN